MTVNRRSALLNLSLPEAIPWKEKGHGVPMQEDHLRQRRDEKGVYWEIDRGGCFEWLKNNGYVGQTELVRAVV